MKTVYDVQQTLKKFGTYIYTGDRIGDLKLMSFEVNELFESGFIEKSEYQMAILILKREINKVNDSLNWMDFIITKHRRFSTICS